MFINRYSCSRLYNELGRIIRWYIINTKTHIQVWWILSLKKMHKLLVFVSLHTGQTVTDGQVAKKKRCLHYSRSANVISAYQHSH